LVEDEPVSFDLAVLGRWMSWLTLLRQRRCLSGATLLVVTPRLSRMIGSWGSYAQLRSRFPDYGPRVGDSLWMSMPLAVGVDHVITHLSWGSRSNAAVTAIMELAAEHRLVIWDPQSHDAHLPWA
jgi:hypothetical protein